VALNWLFYVCQIKYLHVSDLTLKILCSICKIFLQLIVKYIYVPKILQYLNSSISYIYKLWHEFGIYIEKQLKNILKSIITALRSINGCEDEHGDNIEVWIDYTNDPVGVSGLKHTDVRKLLQ